LAYIWCILWQHFHFNIYRKTFEHENFIRIRSFFQTKRLYNSKGNGWDQFKSEQMFVTIFPDELNVLSTNSWLYVIAKKGFAIFGQHCRMDHFPGTILHYYEIIRTSAVAAAHW
jgi:hypothetical protein